MLIDQVYESLHERRLCDSAYDFSVRYLGKSKSYYSVLKARKEPPSIEAISTLESALKKTCNVFSSDKYPFYAKNRELLVKLQADVGKYREQRCNELLYCHPYQ